MKRNKYIVILAIFILVSCSNWKESSVNVDSSRKENQVYSDETLFSTQENFIPSLTPTTTLLVPTLIPYPTIAPVDRTDYIFDLLEANEECDLPCWWGVKPGITTWQGAISFFNSFAFEVNIQRDEYIDSTDLMIVKFSNPFENISIKLFGHNNEIDVIRISGENIVSLNELMKLHGPPEQVYFRAIYAESYPEHFYDLVIFYPELGIMVSQGGKTNLIDASNDEMRICNEQKDLGINVLYIWNPEKFNEFEEVANYGIFLGPPDERELFYPIEDVTNISSTEFYEYFFDYEGKNCIITGIDLWR